MKNSKKTKKKKVWKGKPSPIEALNALQEIEEKRPQSWKTKKGKRKKDYTSVIDHHYNFNA